MTLTAIWNEFQGYDGTKGKNFQLSEVRVQFYKGAMEIPLIAFYPINKGLELNESRIKQFTAVLQPFGLELSCVTEGENYKINRAEDHLYIGRITTEALKLHAERIKDMGWDVFNKIVEVWI